MLVPLICSLYSVQTGSARSVNSLVLRIIIKKMKKWKHAMRGWWTWVLPPLVLRSARSCGEVWARLAEVDLFFESECLSSTLSNACFSNRSGSSSRISLISLTQFLTHVYVRHQKRPILLNSLGVLTLNWEVSARNFSFVIFNFKMTISMLCMTIDLMVMFTV